jgi:hypothetical protein
MINLTYRISILNSIFTVVFYVTRWTKQDHTYIYFEEFLNQLNLLYIYNTFKILFSPLCSLWWDEPNKIPIRYVLKNF